MILQQVADGTLDPSVAAERLSALDRDAEGDRRADADDRPQYETIRKEYVAADGDATIRTVKVGGNFRSVEIIGDKDVREAVAEGPHRARREGGILVIDGTMLEDEDGFVFSRRGSRNVRINVSKGNRPRPLVIRMNPDLDLDARVEAGPLSVEDVHGKVRARVTAGPLRVEGFRRPIDLRVAAGTVKARGRVDDGDSRIECEAGKVLLHLDEGSDVRIVASASLGKVAMGGRQKVRTRVRTESTSRGFGFGFDEKLDTGLLQSKLSSMFADREEIVIGGGRGHLEVNVAMGAADITADDTGTSPVWDDED